MDPMFVAVEGIDGSGSTTCSKALVEAMEEMGVPALWTKEPSDGTIGRHIRKILKGEDAAAEEGMFPLFLADRHDHIASIIQPHLDQGESVICDRYAYSTWVYQQDTYSPFLIEFIQRWCLCPDIVFVLICPVEEAMRRIGKREVVERYEQKERQILYHARYRAVPRIRNERIVYLDTLRDDPKRIVQHMLVEMGF